MFLIIITQSKTGKKGVISLRSVFHFGIDSTGFRENLKFVNRIRNEQGKQQGWGMAQW